MCYTAHQAAITERAAQASVYDPEDPEEVPRDDEPTIDYNDLADPANFDPTDIPMDITSEDALPPPPMMEPAVAAHTAQSAPSQADKTPLKRLQKVVPYPRKAGEKLDRAKTVYEARQQYEKDEGLSPYRDFEDAEKFELAEWMMVAELSGRAETNFLRTRMVSDNCIRTHR